MKKISIGVLFAAILISLLSGAVSAESYFPSGFSAHNLSSFGIPVMSAYKSAVPPVADGLIGVGEYPGPNNGISASSGIGSGLELLSFNTGFTYSEVYPVRPGAADDYSSCRQNTYISYDDEYFYFAVEMSCPESLQIIPLSNARLSDAFAFNLMFGLSQSGNPVDSNSRLLNSYYFDFSDSSCLAVTGNRSVVRQDRESSFSFSISSFSSFYSSTGFSDSNGVQWTAEVYKNNAAMKSVPAVFGTKKYIFESRVPIGDALLSCDEIEKELVRRNLREEKSLVHGFFLSQIALDGSYNPRNLSGGDALCLSTGIGAKNALFPNRLNNSSLTWNEAVRETYPAMGGGTDGIEFVFTPVAFLGTYSAQTQSGSVSMPANKQVSGAQGTVDFSSKAFENSNAPYVMEGSLLPDSVILSQDSENSSKIPAYSESDEPDVTEVEYFESEAMLESDGDKNTSHFGSVIILISAAMILAAVVGTAIILRQKNTDAQASPVTQKNASGIPENKHAGGNRKISTAVKRPRARNRKK